MWTDRLLRQFHKVSLKLDRNADRPVSLPCGCTLCLKPVIQILQPDNDHHRQDQTLTGQWNRSKPVIALGFDGRFAERFFDIAAVAHGKFVHLGLPWRVTWMEG